MTVLDQLSSVGEWVAEYPQSARIFEERQIDYCCGGGKPLVEACQLRGIDVSEVSEQLQHAIAAPEDSEPVLTDVPLTELCEHIEATHHAYLKDELPRLTQLVEKVARVHGDRHPELLKLRDAYAALRAELEPHLLKEERILFPAIRALERQTPTPQFPFGSVSNPVRMMEHEHDNAGEVLRQIRQLTNDFEIHDDVCNTWRVMLESLRSLEADMHQHIHKENNILFPRAEQLHSSRSST